jgi:protoporphyrin/coproporphyrin ferrochelatase
VSYQAILVVSFGGPDQNEDVIPYLENVLRGRPVPRERLLEVAEHYYHFGGKSPINEQNLALIDALKAELAAHGPQLPVYFGNRNWHPFLKDTIQQMQYDGITKAIAFVTSGFSCYSGCRQYRENIIDARELVEQAPTIDKIRVFFNHPGFVQPMAERVTNAYQNLSPDAPLIFTAHSIPTSMANTSKYVQQLSESCRLVAELSGKTNWQLVYQSRSGAPGTPWLEPDILDVVRSLHSEGTKEMVIAPIGFISDHMEVMFDLDTEAADLCQQLGIKMVRAGTVGTHPQFISMIRELVMERMGLAEKRALGLMPPNHDVCPLDCCPRPERPTARPQMATA